MEKYTQISKISGKDLDFKWKENIHWIERQRENLSNYMKSYHPQLLFDEKDLIVSYPDKKWLNLNVEYNQYYDKENHRLFCIPYELDKSNTPQKKFWHPEKNKLILSKESAYWIVRKMGEQKYLLVSSGERYGLPWWTVDPWENFVEALMREITEETWYSEIDLLYISDYLLMFYSISKGNRESNFRLAYCELKSEKNIGQNLAEWELLEYFWVTRDKLLKLVQENRIDVPNSSSILWFLECLRKEKGIEL